MQFASGSEPRAPTGKMADLFAFLGDETAPGTSATCASVQDLETRLRGILADKSTETKVEDVSYTFEIGPVTEFSIAVEEMESQNLEVLGSIAPTLGVAPLGRVQIVDGRMVHTVNANDALMNQPQIEPILQRTVAKHIVTTISACDHSTWKVREVSRTTQGWTFTYQCKDSFQAWGRVHATADKFIPGEYSIRELEPLAASRPALDCRGVITIVFSQTSRTINVTYEHTPMHKTVAELMKELKPLPPARPALPGEMPKKSKSTRKREALAGGEEGRARKKPKTARKSEGRAAPEGPIGIRGSGGKLDLRILATAAINGYPDGIMADHGQADAAEQSRPLKKRRAPRPRKPKAKSNENGQAEAAISQSAANGALHLDSIINVDPAEAARRREKAMQLLNNKGVDIAKMSAEQFSLFANQSSALQTESLAMLVEHGPEKLKIVPPSREGDTPASQSTAASPSASASAPISASTPHNKGGKKKKSTEGADDSPAAAPEPVVAKAQKKLTRGPCNQCKARKLGGKCSKGKPLCNMCAEAGMGCVYAVAVSRKKISEEVVIEDDEEDQEREQREPSALPSPGFSTEPVPQSDNSVNLGSEMRMEASDYFQSTYGLAMSELSQQSMQASISLGVSNTQGRRVDDTLSNPLYALSNPAPQPEAAPAYPTHPASGSPKEMKRRSKGSTTRSTLYGAAEQGRSTLQQPPPGLQDSTAYSQRPNSPYQMHARSRSELIQTDEAQSGTPAPDQQAIARAPRSSTPQQSHTHLEAPNRRISSPTYDATTDLSSLSSFGYENYSNTSNDQSTNRISYQPYQEQQSAENTQPTSYDSYNYNTAGSKTAISQASSSGYSNASAPVEAQWPSTDDRNTISYSNNNSSSTPTTISFNFPPISQTTLQSQINPGSTATPQPRQADSHPQMQQATEEHQSYGTYSNRQTQNQTQKDWDYGFNSGTGFTAANTNTLNFRSTRSNPVGYATSYQQPSSIHARHGYSGHENDALMDILGGSLPNLG